MAEILFLLYLNVGLHAVGGRHGGYLVRAAGDGGDGDGGGDGGDGDGGTRRRLCASKLRFVLENGIFHAFI